MLPHEIIVKQKCMHEDSYNPHPTYKSPYDCADCRDTGLRETVIDGEQFALKDDLPTYAEIQEAVFGPLMGRSKDHYRRYATFSGNIHSEFRQAVSNQLEDLFEDFLIRTLEEDNFKLLKQLMLKSFNLKDFHREITAEVVSQTNTQPSVPSNIP